MIWKSKLFQPNSIIFISVAKISRFVTVGMPTREEKPHESQEGVFTGTFT